MDKEDVAKAIVHALDAFSCGAVPAAASIDTAVHIGGETLAVQTTEGDRYFLEVQDV